MAQAARATTRNTSFMFMVRRGSRVRFDDAANRDSRHFFWSFEECLCKTTRESFCAPTGKWSNPEIPQESESEIIRASNSGLESCLTSTAAFQRPNHSQSSSNEQGHSPARRSRRLRHGYAPRRLCVCPEFSVLFYCFVFYFCAL